MRRDTTIAIGVAVLLIVLGTSYLVWGNRGSSANKPGGAAGSGDTSGATADQDKNGKPTLTGAAQKTATGGAPTLAKRPDSAAPTGPRTGGFDASSSPISPMVRDTAPLTPRPRPAETTIPGSGATGASGYGLTGSTGSTGFGGTATPLAGTSSPGSSFPDAARLPLGTGGSSTSFGRSSALTPGPMPRTATPTTPSVGVLPPAPGLSALPPSTRPSVGMTSPIRVGTVDPLATTTKTLDRSLTPSLTGPVDSTFKPALTTTGKTTTHVIQSGDTYSSLALKYLGHSKYANLIAKANPNIDPRRLRLGAKLNIPAAPETATGGSKDVASSATDSALKAATTTAKPLTATTARRVADPIPADRAYKVSANESWSSLARQCYGDSSRWIELYELNKDRVPRTRSFALPAGTIIELPAGVKINRPADEKKTDDKTTVKSS
ncbi:MAG: LysM peptidoglycan-binding domain-containing protein [Phycisphaerae bacterium]|nr:LysM peptidoglycan-binding domain-containing protein [Phycisphaerae bacterium]